MPPNIEALKRSVLPIASGLIISPGGVAIANTVSTDKLVQPDPVTLEVGAIPAPSPFSARLAAGSTALSNTELKTESFATSSATNSTKPYPSYDPKWESKQRRIETNCPWSMMIAQYGSPVINQPFKSHISGTLKRGPNGKGSIFTAHIKKGAVLCSGKKGDRPKIAINTMSNNVVFATPKKVSKTDWQFKDRLGAKSDDGVMSATFYARPSSG